jgi:hypothetical protein
MASIAAASTVTEALERMRAAGYSHDLELVDGTLRTSDARVVCRFRDAVVEAMCRFEGPSDPGDEMIVLAVRDPASGTRGTIAAAYGPAADPDLVEHLRFRAH